MVESNTISKIEVKMIDPDLGVELIIHASPRDADFILSSWQARANSFRHAWAGYEVEQRKDSLKISVGPSTALRELIASGFFNEYRSLSVISEEIKNRFGISIPFSTLHPTLMFLIKKDLLQRQVLDNDRWGYKKKEGGIDNGTPL